MDVDHPETDQRWNAAARQETETQRLERNWRDLLQELRVVQTGVQLLTGFLLTLPFQQRFDKLAPAIRIVFLLTVGCSVLSTVLLIAPVGLHRIVFRQRQTRLLVSVGHRMAYGGMLLLGLALTGVVVVVVDAVEGPTAAVLCGAGALAVFAAFWVVLPLALRQRSADQSIATRSRTDIS